MKPELDAFANFRSATRARVGLGRVGNALPTRALLELQVAHALARDAVHAAVDFEALAAELAPLLSIRVRSAAPDRASYLRRPDWGRKLAGDVRERLVPLAHVADVCVVVMDGLSASAVASRAASLVHAAHARLQDLIWTPVVLAEQGRVALGDDVAQLLGARLVVVIVGERPGLSVSDSLGIYVTWDPRVGRTDAERNCISNVHADGLSVVEAAEQLERLVRSAFRLRLTGVHLELEDAAGGARMLRQAE